MLSPHFVPEPGIWNKTEVIKVKEKICEKCFKESSMLYGGMCHECLVQTKMEANGGNITYNNETMQIYLTPKKDTEEKNKKIHMVEHSRQDIKKYVGTRAGKGLMVKWCRLYFEEAEKGILIRLGLNFTDGAVSDVEVPIRVNSDAVTLHISKRTNDSLYRCRKWQKDRQGYRFKFSHPDDVKDKHYWEQWALKKRARMEKLMLDRMVEEQQEAVGEV